MSFSTVLHARKKNSQDTLKMYSLPYCLYTFCTVSMCFNWSKMWNVIFWWVSLIYQRLISNGHQVPLLAVLAQNWSFFFYQFISLISYLHISGRWVEPARGGLNFRHLYKVKGLMDTLVATAVAIFMPRHRLTLDKSVIHFTGHLVYHKYMLSKPFKFRCLVIVTQLNASLKYLSQCLMDFVIKLPQSCQQN